MSETNENKKDDFQKMLSLAEFGVKRMEERRSVEFRIFISYMTLLVLALYQLFKSNLTNIDSQIEIAGLSLALLIHIIYVMWQVGVGIAMKNDATRRNFYLKKAECISGHPLKYPCKKSDSGDKIFPIENYGQQLRHLSIIWTEWSRMLLVAIPTFLFIIVVAVFIMKTELSFKNWSIGILYGFLLFAIPFLLSYLFRFLSFLFRKIVGRVERERNPTN